MVGTDHITQIVLEHTKTQQKKWLDVDDLIINYGFVSLLERLKKWGLNINKNAIIVNSKQETNISGIYAAGIFVRMMKAVKLIASGFGEGPTAVNNAKAYIDPLAESSAAP